MRRFGYAAQVRRSAADRDRPRLVADAGEVHVDRVRWQERRQLVRPLDDGHAVAPIRSSSPRSMSSVIGVGPIGVDVIDEEAALVLVDEDERRTRRADCRAETSRQP